MRRRLLVYGLLWVVILLCSGVRFRLRNIPLERDEGEYAYGGQLILEGIAPYELAYTMKLPGTHVAYAVMEALFGQTSAGIHLGLLLANVVTILLVYMLGLRLSGQIGGLVAAASYGLLSISYSVLGIAAHATHFIVIPALAGILLLLDDAAADRKPWKLFASGLMFGLAFLMKQPGIVFAIFGELYVFKKEWPRLRTWKDLLSGPGCYMAGALLPFGLTCLAMVAAGVFKSFWFWVFTYAKEYASEISLSSGAETFRENFPAIVSPAVGVWIIAALGLAALWRRENRSHAALVVGFLLSSFAGVCPGLYFREHYFILTLPVVSLLAGIGVHSAVQALSRVRRGWALTALPVLLFSGVLGCSVFQMRAYLFQLDPVTVSRELYGGNPFSEAPAVAEYLKVHTSPNDKIAVLGSEPEIYFYARRHSATGFIYMYGLMEEQRYWRQMQKEMMDEVQSSNPKFLVVVNSDLSWLSRPGSPQTVSFASWFETYASSRYKKVEDWDRSATGSEGTSSRFIEVLQRKD